MPDGSGEFGRVKVSAVPGEGDSGLQFIDEDKGANIPKEFIPSVEKDFHETAKTGHLIGLPIILYTYRQERADALLSETVLGRRPA